MGCPSGSQSEVNEGKSPLSRARRCCAWELNFPTAGSHAVTIATDKSGFPGMQKKFIAIMLDLLPLDRPWSRAAPTSLNAAESLMGNAGFSTQWGKAGQKILV